MVPPRLLFFHHDPDAKPLALRRRGGECTSTAAAPCSPFEESHDEEATKDVVENEDDDDDDDTRMLIDRVLSKRSRGGLAARPATHAAAVLAATATSPPTNVNAEKTIPGTLPGNDNLVNSIAAAVIRTESFPHPLTHASILPLSPHRGNATPTSSACDGPCVATSSPSNVTPPIVMRPLVADTRGLLLPTPTTTSSARQRQAPSASESTPRQLAVPIRRGSPAQTTAAKNQAAKDRAVSPDSTPSATRLSSANDATPGSKPSPLLYYRRSVKEPTPSTTSPQRPHGAQRGAGGLRRSPEVGGATSAVVERHQKLISAGKDDHDRRRRPVVATDKKSRLQMNSDPPAVDQSPPLAFQPPISRARGPPSQLRDVARTASVDTTHQKQTATASLQRERSHRDGTPGALRGGGRVSVVPMLRCTLGMSNSPDTTVRGGVPDASGLVHKHRNSRAADDSARSSPSVQFERDDHHVVHAEGDESGGERGETDADDYSLEFVEVPASPADHRVAVSGLVTGHASEVGPGHADDGDDPDWVLLSHEERVALRRMRYFARWQPVLSPRQRSSACVTIATESATVGPPETIIHPRRDGDVRAGVTDRVNTHNQSQKLSF